MIGRRFSRGLALHPGDNLTERQGGAGGVAHDDAFLQDLCHGPLPAGRERLFPYLGATARFDRESSRHFAMTMNAWASTSTSLNGRWPPTNSPATPPCCSASGIAPSANGVNTSRLKRSLWMLHRWVQTRRRLLFFARIPPRCHPERCFPARRTLFICS